MIHLNEPLPYAVHELLGSALDDVEACRANGMTINMDEWIFWPDEDKPCSLCLAGAAVINRIDPEELKEALMHWPALGACSFGASTRDKMRALNYLRAGDTESASHYLPPEFGDAIARGDIQTSYAVPDYTPDSHALWMAAMRNLQSIFKTAGV